MKSTLYTIVSLLFVLFASCSQSNNDIKFDSDRWKSDKNGCQSIRKSMKDQFLKIKPKVIKRSEQEVIGLLGKPDIQQLDNRSKKSYIYFIDPGNECKNKVNRPSKLIIEFNSINQVRFATFQKW